MKRVVESLLAQRLKQFPCVAVAGVRQCGKTTLLRSLPAFWRRFDLEKTEDLEFIQRDRDLFFRLQPDHVAIDEAQFDPALFPALRVAIDQKRSKKGRFVVTGSSSPTLIKSMAESLAGRVSTIEMSPLTLGEAYKSVQTPFADCFALRSPLKGILSLVPRWTLAQVHQFWFHGGYPEPWLHKSFAFGRQWMSEYTNTYLQRDLVTLFPGLNRQRFATLLRYLGQASGDIINLVNMGQVLGLSPSVVSDYLNIAHGTFIWRRLPAYEKRATKRLVRHPKGYLRDSGLLHSFLKIPDIHSLLSHPRLGASWESFIVEEILKTLHAKGIHHDAFYYRTGAGAEVDLVLEGFFGCVPIEIKHTQKLDHYALRSLQMFIDEHKCPFGIVIHNGTAVRRLTNEIIAVPPTCF